MALTTIRLFSSDNLDSLNTDLWRTIYTKGRALKFGSKSKPKAAREIFAVIQIYGKALKDLYEGRLPKKWMFGAASNQAYIIMLSDPDPGDQPYTYGQRLKHIPVWDGAKYSVRGTWIADCCYLNQLETARNALKISIEEGIQSNRICGVLWIPTDIALDSPPCFQWFQVRVTEKNKVSLRILFRSHDYGNAEMANFGAIIKVFTDEVLAPAGAELEELICVSTSAHLYLNDFNMIESVVGYIPEPIRRLMGGNKVAVVC